MKTISAARVDHHNLHLNPTEKTTFDWLAVPKGMSVVTSDE
jgi:hypothetical protein